MNSLTNFTSKRRTTMKLIRKFYLHILPVSFAVFFSVGVVELVSANVKDDIVTAPIDKGMLEAEITHVASNVLLVKKEDGETSRIPMPGESGKSATEFSKGDKIQAVITPQGTTTSVRKMPKEK